MDAFPTMEEFGERYGIAINDPDLRRQYNLFIESTLEMNTIKADAWEEGREAGLKERQEEIREETVNLMAARFRELGFGEELIRQVADDVLAELSADDEGDYC